MAANTSHPSFVNNQPENDNVKLWRYMDFIKLNGDINRLDDGFIFSPLLYYNISFKLCLINEFNS